MSVLGISSLTLVILASGMNWWSVIEVENLYGLTEPLGLSISDVC